LFCRERAASTELWSGNKLTVFWDLKTDSRGLSQRFIHNFSAKMCKNNEKQFNEYFDQNYNKTSYCSTNLFDQ